MSEKIEKPKFDPTKAKMIEVSEIPSRSTKGIWYNWIAVLQNLSKTPLKALTINEKEGSIIVIRNQISKAIKFAKIENIVVNTRNVNKLQTLYVSYKKSVTTKK